MKAQLRDFKEKSEQEREAVLQKFKDRLQMDLEFKAFQKYGVKEVELEEASGRMVRERERMEAEREREVEERVREVRQQMERRMEANQVEVVRDMHQQMEQQLQRLVKQERSKVAREMKAKIGEEVEERFYTLGQEK